MKNNKSKILGRCCIHGMRSCYDCHNSDVTQRSEAEMKIQDLDCMGDVWPAAGAVFQPNTPAALSLPGSSHTQLLAGLLQASEHLSCFKPSPGTSVLGREYCVGSVHAPSRLMKKFSGRMLGCCLCLISWFVPFKAPLSDVWEKLTSEFIVGVKLVNGIRVREDFSVRFGKGLW